MNINPISPVIKLQAFNVVLRVWYGIKRNVPLVRGCLNHLRLVHYIHYIKCYLIEYLETMENVISDQTKSYKMNFNSVFNKRFSVFN